MSRSYHRYSNCVGGVFSHYTRNTTFVLDPDSDGIRTDVQVRSIPGMGHDFRKALALGGFDRLNESLLGSSFRGFRFSDVSAIHPHQADRS